MSEDSSYGMFLPFFNKKRCRRYHSRVYPLLESPTRIDSYVLRTDGLADSQILIGSKLRNKLIASMYFKIVKLVLDDAIEHYAKSSGLSVDDVLGTISRHIQKTSDEYRNTEPEIDYQNPLCRLGYFYRHVPANATLFEWVLQRSSRLQKKLEKAKQESLHICSIGGGPGTELLGLGKYLLQIPQHRPRDIKFSVLDNVPQWSETWERLAEAVAAELGKASPVIAPSFNQLDVLDESSYKDYAFKFRKTDIVVFNYLFSENKTRLNQAQAVLRHLAKVTPEDCVFVVIDRLEHDEKFTNDVVKSFVNAGFPEPKFNKISGSMDGDEKTGELGKIYTSKLGSPRLKFSTTWLRDPTVFWFVSAKG